MIQGRIFIQARKRKVIHDQYDNFYPEEIDQSTLLSKRILNQSDYFYDQTEKRYCNIDLQYQIMVDGITVIPEQRKQKDEGQQQGDTIRLSKQSRNSSNTTINDPQETFRWFQVQERDYIDELGLNETKVKKRQLHKKVFDNSIHKYKF